MDLKIGNAQSQREAEEAIRNGFELVVWKGQFDGWMILCKDQGDAIHLRDKVSESFLITSALPDLIHTVYVSSKAGMSDEEVLDLLKEALALRS